MLFPEILKANMIQPTLCVFVYERQERAGMFEDKGSLVHSGALSSLHFSFVYTVNSPTSSILHCLSLSFSVSLPLVTHSFSTRSVIRVYTLATFYSPHELEHVGKSVSTWTCTSVSHLNQKPKLPGKKKRCQD